MSVDSKTGTQPLPELPEGSEVDPQVLQDLWQATQEADANSPLNKDAQRIIELGQKPRNPDDLFPEEDDGIAPLKDVLPEDAIPAVIDDTVKAESKPEEPKLKLEDLFPSEDGTAIVEPDKPTEDKSEPESVLEQPRAVTELSASDLSAMSVEELREIAPQLTAEQWSALTGQTELLTQLDPDFELRKAAHSAVIEAKKEPDPKSERVDLGSADALVMAPHDQFLEMLGDTSKLTPDQVAAFFKSSLDPDYQNRMVLLLEKLSPEQIAAIPDSFGLLGMLRGDQITRDVLGNMGVATQDAAKLLSPDQLRTLSDDTLNYIGRALKGEQLTAEVVQRIPIRSVDATQIYSIQDPQVRAILIDRLAKQQDKGDILMMLSHLKEEDLQRLLAEKKLEQRVYDDIQERYQMGIALKFTEDVEPQGLTQDDYFSEGDGRQSVKPEAVTRISLQDVAKMPIDLIMEIFNKGLQRSIVDTRVFDALVWRRMEEQNRRLNQGS